MARGAVNRGPSFNFARSLACAALLSTSSSVGGCAAAVTLEDDDGGRSSGDDASSEGGASAAQQSGTGAQQGSGAGPSDAAALADAQAACTDYYYSCNGIDSSLGVGLYDCNNIDILAECAPALAALYRCATQPGGTRYTQCDPELESRCRHDLGFDFYRCMSPYSCGSTSTPPECEQSEDQCACTEGCDDGHAAHTECVPIEGGDSCDCYFDGAMVGQCTNDFDTACFVEGSCCERLMR